MKIAFQNDFYIQQGTKV